MSKRTFLITGGTGLIGSAIAETLFAAGHTIHILTRSPQNYSGPYAYFKWDIAEQYIDPAAFDQVTDLIHLAGASVAGEKWTTAYKKELITSRVDTAHCIIHYLEKLSIKLQRVYSASAIGYYGDRSANDICTECSEAGDDGFIVTLTKKWEEAGKKLGAYADDYSLLRFGLVLSKDGGFMDEMTKGLALRTVSYFGDGSQVLSWIHIDDIAQFIIFSLDKKIEPIINMVSPHPVNGKEMAQQIAEIVSGKQIVAPVPKFAIRLAFGQRASVILMSNRVEPAALKKMNYHFKYEFLPDALRKIFE